MDKKDLPTLAFADLASWERWLCRQGAEAPGVWLKFAKAGAPQPTLRKAEAIEGALSHGWIDGQLARLDEHYFLTRFTPRRRGSPWSRINRETAQRLIVEGRMAVAGRREIEAAKADGRWENAYASQANATVPDDLGAALKAVPAARRFFDALDGANRYAIIWRVMQAKKPDTRARRISQYVDMLLRGETIHATAASRRQSGKST